MLLNTVIIILREVLEAALLISVLLAISHLLSLKLRWLMIAGVTGITGAFIYQANFERISSAFDFVGQEVTNAFLQLGIYFCIATIVFYINVKPAAGKLKIIAMTMCIAVSLAIIREGSEILIYLSGFAEHQIYLWSAVTGGMIGISIGMSVGALIFYLLRSRSPYILSLSSQSLLALVAAAMLSQASQLLIQADWLPSQHTLWDSSGLLNEDSITGQLLYAIAGYEATPTIIQLGAYLFALASILLLAFYKKNLIGKAPQ